MGLSATKSSCTDFTENSLLAKTRRCLFFGSFPARVPEGETPPPPRVKEYEDLRIPSRKDPRTADRYGSYDQKVLKLLVILGVKMDLIGLVSKPDNPGIDERRFRQLTDPRSPDTGIRYANLMRRFLDFLGEVENSDRSETDGGAISPDNVGRFVELGVFRSPLRL